MVKRLRITNLKIVFGFILILIVLFSNDLIAQSFTQDFNGAFPPAGPPLVTDSIGTGTSDQGGTENPPGQVKWYRSDNPILGTLDPGSFPNDGLNPGRGGTGFCAAFDTWAISSGGKASLIFHNVNMTGFTTPRLRFWLRNTTGSDKVRVFMRKTDTWVQVGATSYGVFTDWSQQMIVLTAYAGTGNDSVDIRFEAESDFGATNYGLDDVSLDENPPQTYISSVAAQTNTNELHKGVPRQEVLSAQIIIDGTLTPLLVAQSFYFSTAGTTTAADITNARLYYTGTTNAYSKSTPVGSVVVNPNGSFSITGVSQSLNEGTNYFWLAYDIAAGATTGNVVDATFDSVVISGITRVPVISAPVGTRQIQPAPSINQTPGTIATGSGNGRAPATHFAFNRSANIYPVAEVTTAIASGAVIKTLGFNIGTLGAGQAAVTGNIKIYLENSADLSYNTTTKGTAWSTIIAPMTLVYDGPLTILPKLGGYEIRLQTPFTYTGASMYMAFDWSITGAVSTAAVYACSSTPVGGTSGNRTGLSATAAPATVGTTSAFRPTLRLGVDAFPNDVSVEIVTPKYSKLPIGAGNPNEVKALIKNNGYNSITNYPVDLTVTGANPATASATATLDYNESMYVTLSTNVANPGIDLLTVSVAADDLNTNNSKAASEEITTNQYSYSDNTASTGSVGYGTGSGIIANKYHANGGWLVDSVKVHIANNAATAGKQIFAVVLNSLGEIIAKSDTFTPVAGDLNKVKSFIINNPQVVYNEDFYVGLNQVAGVSYFPIGTQTEAIPRVGAYYTAPAAGGVIPSENNTLGRFMIDATIAVPLPPPTVSLGPDHSICAGDSVLLDAGNPGMTYLWSTGATTQSIYAKTTDAYIVTVRNSQGYPVKDTVNVLVNPILPVSASIAANPVGAVCSGTSVTFTATPTNGGVTPSYQWLKNNAILPGETGSTYTSTTLADDDSISVILTSSEACKSGSPDTSNIIVMTITATSLPVLVSVAPTVAGPYCQGTSVTFEATPSNGGTAPAYEWYVNNVLVTGEITSSYTTTGLNDEDTIKVKLTSNSVCILGSPTAEAEAGVVVNPVLPVSVSIATPSTSVCAAAMVTFTATPVNEGTAPTYEWKKNGFTVTGETNPTYTTNTLIDGDVITVVLTSNETCKSGSPATSNPVTITVLPHVVPAVSLSAAPGADICAGTSVTFTASPTNGGTAPTFEWRKNGTIIAGEITAIYTTPLLANADDISVQMTSNADCILGSATAGDTITMTVNAEPNASFTSVVAGNTVTFTNTTSPSGTSVWNFGDGNTSTATSPSHTYAGPGTYNVKLVATNPCGSDSVTNPVTINVGIDNNYVSGKISVYPNPGNGALSLGFDLADKDDLVISVLDISGKEVYNEKVTDVQKREVKLDLTHLSNGMYLLKVNGNKGNYTERIQIVK